ncbi:siderophore-interacting protein [Actinophytocola oryzae]|uniref:NADPH-dependent ferric siderophore reductase n=1 Tax=Actinophytocola oryzae TaxID=502181 RepID=A0A4R7VRJ9_9PSEU|nr:siderophore-interacting protein [Actinophytocola oryzae]TDV52282.1 NADPH-dependent ferric siderophore reductase [Actinophytocola oryzae]
MTTTETEVQSYVLFRVEVVRTERLSPKMLRVTFAGPELAGCVTAGHDQRIKMFFPRAGETDPVVPEGPNWFPDYRAMPQDVKPAMRTFTIRALRPDVCEMDVDFVLHGDLGPASRWAGRATPGDRVAILGPNLLCPTIYGYEYRPDADTDWTLLAGDETALPAITGILAAMPAGRRALVFLEVESTAEIKDLPCPGDARITWLSRDGAPGTPGGLLRGAIARTDFPAGRPYAWLAGESSAVTGLRRHLVNERGVDRKDVYFSGYWLLGGAIE